MESRLHHQLSSLNNRQYRFWDSSPGLKCRNHTRFGDSCYWGRPYIRAVIHIQGFGAPFCWTAQFIQDGETDNVIHVRNGNKIASFDTKRRRTRSNWSTKPCPSPVQRKAKNRQSQIRFSGRTTTKQKETFETEHSINQWMIGERENFRESDWGRGERLGRGSAFYGCALLICASPWCVHSYGRI